MHYIHTQQWRCALESHTKTTTGEIQSSTVQLGLKTNENAHLFKECTLHICSFIRCLVFMRVNVLLYSMRSQGLSKKLAGNLFCIKE